LTTTVGGTTSGYSLTGSNGIEIRPATRMTIDNTAAKIGRSQQRASPLPRIDLSKDPLHHDRATRRLQPGGNRGATGHLAGPISGAEERLAADVPGMGRAHRSAHRRTQAAEDRYCQLHLRAHEGVCGRSLGKARSRRFCVNPPYQPSKTRTTTAHLPPKMYRARLAGLYRRAPSLA
jgi:hypothetical protein